jgi:putative membrane protein
MVLGITKNDKRARILIVSFSIIVFIAVTALERVTLDVKLPFNEHFFAQVNAVINSIVAMLLIGGLYTAKNGRYTTHKYIMLSALVLSILFLVSYILHHLFAGSAFYGDVDGNGIVSEAEKLHAGTMRYVYFVLLGTHILLAGISLPYILFTVHRPLRQRPNVNYHKLLKYQPWLPYRMQMVSPILYFCIS